MTLRLLIVGEGERDRAAIPRLVERIVAEALDEEFEAWPRLHDRGSGRGFGRKLKFAVRQAIDRALQGVVATVDADQRQRSDKLIELKRARNDDREKGVAVPTALGEAIPHLEAWLLDDPVAVRTVLVFDAATEIAVPTKVKSPKDALNEHCLATNCGKSLIDVLAEIASTLDLAHCNQADKTGLTDFCDDVKSEFGPLCKPSAIA